MAPRGLGLFVRWPGEKRADRQLCAALARALSALPGGLEGRAVESILIDPEAAPTPQAIGVLLDHLAGQVAVASDLEATLVVATRDVVAGALAEYGAAGINRLSLKALTLDPAALALLHDAGSLFPRIALDLSFGQPGQSLADWRATLDRAFGAGVGHLSIEEASCAEGRSGAADVDRMAALYQLACVHLEASGMPAYEITHFARPGQKSRQLLRVATGGDYLGIGPGAVGRITTDQTCWALDQVGPSSTWLRAVDRGVEAERRLLSREDRMIELVLNGLRLRSGIGRHWFEPLVGATVEDVLDPGRLTELIEDGFLQLDRDGLRLSEGGWPLCDSVLVRLLA